VLVHHPYDSFATSVQRFIEQAAADPHVLAIKQTLYRTSGDSPIVDALVDAAQAGKQVVVLVEITARFDEQANIRWARELEKAGCHVVYGLVGLKTHCKTSLVVRQEKGQLRRYAHIGTGNYNPKTARMYEDFGLLTADPEVGADLTDLFNTLTGYSRQTRYRTLMVAPHGVRAGLVERIRRQADLARQGLPARVRIKANSVVDEQVIDALYGASRAGVPVELVVRGICALKPGVPGCPRTSTCGASSAASSSTRASWCSAEVTTPSTGWAAQTSCTATWTVGSRRSCGSRTRPWRRTWMPCWTGRSRRTRGTGSCSRTAAGSSDRGPVSPPATCRPSS
jgi:polyphosphate kinase